MKGFLRHAALIAIPLLLAACGDITKPTTKDLEQALNLNLEGAVEISYEDSHGGFHGDGLSCIVLEFKHQDIINQIQQDSRWNPLPLDKTAHAILREHDFSGMGLDLKKAIPEIKEGFYRLRDRQKQANNEPDLLKRPSLNLTIAVFDSTTQKLYVVDIDT